MTRTTPTLSFPTRYDSILERIQKIKPVRYARTRNFLDGDVTYLSPYISRGVISTKQVMESVLDRGIPPSRMEKFLQELAWRDYWQQVWIEKGDLIDSDLKHPQWNVDNYQMPTAIAEAETGVEAVDRGIDELYHTGYMHNHMRMYVASLACNIGRSHWLVPARWMYYHLLDGDWASNALSWQWVAGSNSRKKYFANQGNINKYCHTSQRGTFLDTGYDELTDLEIPDILRETSIPDMTTSNPTYREVDIDPALPTLVYNYYNLDPTWRAEERANRILLLEPSVFERYPVSARSVEFARALARNIQGIQLFAGRFDDLAEKAGASEVIFREHPLNSHYRGTQDERDWMFPVKGYYPSFFAFWKRCKKHLKEW